jgi:hypothetical protein
MCLIIDKNKHPLGTSKVNLKPVIVYKIIMKTKTGFKTPFRCYPIDFIEHECVLKSKLIKDCYIVDKGIHAYRSLSTAVARVRDMDMHAWVPAASYSVFKAIIPKFSNYYIGCDGDIVSNKMIITDEARWFI